MNFGEVFRAHLRLAIVQALRTAANYELHEYLLLDLVRGMGLRASSDALRTEIEWLAEQGMVMAERIEGAYVPRLTTRGLDAADGTASIPGVSRPRP